MNIGKRWIIKNYILNHPDCTYKDIKRDTKLKVERFYKNMKEAYIEAGVPLSKNLTKRDKKEQKQEVIKYIQENPSCTVTQITDTLSVNIFKLFKSIKTAYN